MANMTTFFDFKMNSNSAKPSFMENKNLFTDKKIERITAADKSEEVAKSPFKEKVNELREKKNKEVAKKDEPSKSSELKTEKEQPKEAKVKEIKNKIKEVSEKIESIEKKAGKGEKPLELSLQLVLSDLKNVLAALKQQLNANPQTKIAASSKLGSASFKKLLAQFNQLIEKLANKMKGKVSSKNNVKDASLFNTDLNQLSTKLQNLAESIQKITGETKELSQTKNIGSSKERKIVDLKIDQAVIAKVSSQKGTKAENSESTVKNQNNNQQEQFKLGEGLESKVKGKTSKQTQGESSFNQQKGSEQKNFSEVKADSLNVANNLKSVNENNELTASSFEKLTKADKVKLAKDILNQMGEKIRGKIGVKRSHVTIELKPEALGKIKIMLDMKNDVLKGKVIVENPQVKGMLEERLNEVKAILEQSGVKLAGLEVATQGGKSYQEQANEFEMQKNIAKNRVVNELLDNQSKTESYERTASDSVELQSQRLSFTA